MRLSGTAIVLHTALILSACTPTRPPDALGVSRIVDQYTRDVNREVAEAGEYNGVLQPLATNTVSLANPSYIVDDALMRFVDAEFTGRIEDFVSLIARETGYSVRADGEKPGAPIVIILVRRDIPALGALRDALHQAKTAPA
ncbi:DotD/TraH family lipoprotein [Labrenzia sp. DG1229]|uniref:DotD/TraH family lipoprotein n=1 Tax=Labrenzia sp. DG1229 TaxID=681847 RepID=UPI00048C9385|nr:DotD/TraH family lipoprotein [Labrenzia sp. DG1229]